MTYAVTVFFGAFLRFLKMRSSRMSVYAAVLFLENAKNPSKNPVTA